MKWLLAGVVGVVGLAGCASDGAVAQYGGVERQMRTPASTTPCETAGISLVREGEMVIPRDSMPEFHMASTLETMNRVAIVYDVAANGRATNIRYGGNPDDFNSDARRSLIRAMADHVETFEYSWADTPSHAVACRYSVDVET